MYQTFSARHELAPFVECYWRWASEKETSDVELILPDAAPELIVHLGVVPSALSERGCWREQPRAFVYCAAQRCLQLRIAPPMDVFAIRFRPWGLSRFSSRHMSAMLDREVTPNSALGGLGDSLVEIVLGSDGDLDRVQRVEERLITALDVRPPRAESHKILVDALGRGEKPAQALAKGLECSPRSVRRVWRELVGISPRAYGKLMRVHRALAMIEEGRPLAAVAFDCGYSDQPHMARHIREIAGVPASRLRSWLGESVYQDLYAQRPAAPWQAEHD
jgi:AraC-like DNA-binding protein